MYLKLLEFGIGSPRNEYKNAPVVGGAKCGQAKSTKTGGTDKKGGYTSFFLTMLYQLLHLLAFTGKIFQIS